MNGISVVAISAKVEKTMLKADARSKLDLSLLGMLSFGSYE